MLTQRSTIVMSLCVFPFFFCLPAFIYSIEHYLYHRAINTYKQTMTVTMATQVKAKMNLSTGAPLPYLFIHLFYFFSLM